MRTSPSACAAPAPSTCPDGRVSHDAFSHSVALVRARTVIPTKVDMPRRLDKLLLMEPLEEALHR